jgi:signal transduction histidine kinase
VLALWATVCALLALVPRWWLEGWSVRTQDRWFIGALNKAGRLPQAWENADSNMPKFTRGDEPALQKYLARECLIEALVDAKADRVWVRVQDRLRPATATEAIQPRDWTIRALAATGYHRRWIPERPRTEAWRGKSVVVAFDGQWWQVKAWTPGSPEVERWLEQNLESKDGYRFGVLNSSDFHDHIRKVGNHAFLTGHESNAAPRTLQVTNLSDAPFRYIPDLNHYFGDPWFVVVMMSPAEFQSFRNAYHFHRRMAWLAYGALVGISGLGMALFLFSQQRERIQADHLASLAHSLKTPLAVLRSRCDTVLNEDLERGTRQSHLLQIGSEVSQLTRLIERGLEQTRPGVRGPAGDRIDDAFFEALDEELTPAFEAKGRQLEVYCSGVAFHAPASSLRTALVTLLENALLHGEKTVELRAIQVKGRITFSVQDEGPGLSPEVVQALQDGSPNGAPSPVSKPGQRLGLLMLRRLARNEGWGLSLENLEPGFRACLVIQT